MKFEFWRKSCSEISVSICFSLWLGLVYNFLTICRKVSVAYSKSEYLAIFELFLTNLLNISLILTVIILLSFYRRIFLVFALILLLLSTISLYIQSKFGIIFDDIMLVNGLDSLGHLGDVCDFAIFGYLLIFWIFPGYFLVSLEIKKSPLKKRIIAVSFTTIFAGLCLIANNKDRQELAFEIYSPINYLGSFERYLSRFHENREIAKNRQSLIKSHQFSTKNLPKNLKVILVLGESLRVDHLHLSGYHRQTTPNLEKLPDLIKFQLQANFNTTSPAITSLLSHLDNQDLTKIPLEKSLVDLFRQIGFHTCWFSNQSSKEFGNGMLNIMAMEADEYFFRNRLKNLNHNSKKVYDEALLPFLQKELKEDRKSLIILHSFGSHIRYTDRYPKEFAKFQPECSKSPKSCKIDDLINSYDNTVLYTDFFLSEVVKSLEGKNAVMFYISDHGNFLGEDGQFANGNNLPNLQNSKTNQAQIVPMMIYVSQNLAKLPKYRKKFQIAEINSKKSWRELSAEKSDKKLRACFQNLLIQEKFCEADLAKEPRSKVNEPSDNFSLKTGFNNQRVFFDSLLDCIGIESDLLQKRNLSVCR